MGAGGQNRGQRSPRCDAPGGQHLRLGVPFNQIHQERQQVHLTGMAPGLVALGQQHIGSGLHCQFGQLRRLHLADGDCPGVLGPGQPGLWVSEGENYYRRPLLQDDLEVDRVCLDKLGDEAHAEGTVGLRPNEGYLLPQPVGAEIVAAAEGAQTAGPRYRRGQLAAAVVAHWGGHYGVDQAQQFGKASLQHRRSTLCGVEVVTGVRTIAE